MMTAHWTLSQALAWIASKGSEEAVAAAPLTTLEMFLVDEAIDFGPAKAALWSALSQGKLTASGIGSSGMDDLRTEIPAMLWQDLQPVAYPRQHHIEERLQRPGLNTGEAFTKVTVPSAVVMKRWPSTPAKGKRGPKPKVDQVAFIRVAHEWIAENGMPDPKLDPRTRKVDLENYMMEWHRDAIAPTRNRELVTIAMRTYVAAISGN